MLQLLVNIIPYLLYHTYAIPDGTFLEHAVAFAYASSFRCILWLMEPDASKCKDRENANITFRKDCSDDCEAGRWDLIFIGQR